MTTTSVSSTPTEEHLTELFDALTYVMGEEGLSRMIVTHLRDCFRLDAIERIRASTDLAIVLSEMHPYLDDSTVCLIGIQAILAIMGRFTSKIIVIRTGFRALRNIVHNHETNADILVTKLGGIPFLAERMKQFHTDADAMKNACWLLQNLSCFEQLRKQIVDAKALSALASAFDFDGHKDNPDIQKPARQAIFMLVSD
jgi:hypothetical protein